MDKGYFIQFMEPGERLTEFFALRKNELRDYEGKPYLALELGDRTGRISASYWGDDAMDIHTDLHNVSVIKVRGVVTERRGKNFFKIERLRPAENDEFELERLLPLGKYTADQLMAAYRKRVNALGDGQLERIFKEKVFENEELLNGLRFAPGGKLWHHTYLGGLLEHSLSVHRICLSASLQYPDIDRPLLLAAALLHDIGKIFEFSTSVHIDYTEKGRLMGHIFLGAEWAGANCCEYLDYDRLNHLVHMILSHHGEGQMGSPVKPLTIEASILHHADLMDSQANAFSRVIEREKDSGYSFSNWVKIAERFLYLKPYQQEEEE